PPTPRAPPTAAFPLAPLLAEGRQRLLPAFALLLDELLGARLPGRGSFGHLAKVLFGHDRILVLAKSILELLGHGDESSGAAPDDRLHEFGGVPCALHLDTDRVELLGTRLPGQLGDRPS